MRREDRKPSKRVFPLLQNTDLENVSFATLQSTGQPISIEDMNEQEMIDLIIVNLARLSVKQEWDGLLTAGGTPTFNARLPQIGAWTGSTERYTISMAPPYSAGSTTQNSSFSDYNYPKAFPFVSPKSGDVSEIGIYVAATTTSADCLVGIYTDSGKGAPDALMGFADIDLGSTGNIYQTSLSATITLVEGTQYWYVIGADATATGGTIRGNTDTDLPALGIGDNPTQTRSCLSTGAFTALPDPYVATNVQLKPRIFVSLKIG